MEVDACECPSVAHIQSVFLFSDSIWSACELLSTWGRS